MLKRFRSGWLFPAILCLLFTMNSHANDISAPAVADRLVKAAEAFWTVLSDQQRKRLLFTFEDQQRYEWHYVPRGRVGLPLKGMREVQRSLALAFLETGLSPKGYRKAVTITQLETVLREIETGNPMGRDPDNYFFSFFGHPSINGTWGWRLEGHHLSLNFTIVKGHLFSSAPRFLGANPAKVDHGFMAGTRTLAQEEDLARTLVKSMNKDMLAKAVFSQRPYRDIVTGSAETVSPLEAVGISAGELNQSQQNLLFRLIEEYLSSLPSEIARQRLETIRQETPERIGFGWAGGLAPGQPHYYRIQGRSFLIEYDNVQNGANHIHSVWRDFDGDFGRDLLQEHYRADHP